MENIHRRTLLKTAPLGALAFTSACQSISKTTQTNQSTSSPNNLAKDEAFWAHIASQYDMKPDIINVENGNWGVMSRPVLNAYIAHTERVNRDNSFFSRREFYGELRPILENLATRLDVSTSELAITRGATEALFNIINGFNKLQAGDGVMIADLDYDSVRDAMRNIAKQNRCELIELTLPEPASFDAIITHYTQALENHPNTKLLLLTHISHRTGLAIPVREITQIAQARGVRVVVDAAHSWGQMDFTLSDLGADFVGLNLHKWIGAPIGVGLMYIREDRLAEVSPNICASDGEQDKIYGRVHTGTSNFAAILTVPDALAFHDMIGPKNKEARLKYLRSLWVDACKDNSRIQILTPEDNRLHAGITSFRLKDITSTTGNKALAEHLLKEHNVFCVHRNGIASGSCIRITPNVYNSPADMSLTAKAVIKTALNYSP
ncbi:aminotransferase class V-fold PLP-dependent enzyme [Hirschia baltica]|uniref:Aminotransferase class V n=1 Tax=Hirschia baltica (strain ATCC 49814 / DSM 5838 / IFAM 1418) TaxID=582402 RepID=C6XQ83_HIRBI|nr:aminotransferase class V-fold PLP-dependent enzyme [Hirschia baltica]ACT60382.1 aminotransferase class V [Hirschia baltica ATCC 49814]